MELQNFIEESLKQIVAAVATAGKAAKEHGASLNPRQKQWRYGEGIYFDKSTGAVLSNVEFDIAVTASGGTKTKGGIGVAIASVVLGSQGESSKTTQNVSRIKFSIPVVFPSTEEED
ncbi:MAG: hypothetical protein H7A53_07075 [Akkermansiaceae bacterium]|nr:hypothetical protein [Akkermansiaceae bacterium]MCP5550635.1 hypothetical protein [Akkermansiaceae bacterium]